MSQSQSIYGVKSSLSSGRQLGLGAVSSQHREIVDTVDTLPTEGATGAPSTARRRSEGGGTSGDVLNGILALVGVALPVALTVHDGTYVVR
jgi:hypothetical protein